MKKKIISLILVLVFALSLVSCFKDDRRYDYDDMSKYVTLANYFNREIEIEKEYITQTIANYRKEFATTPYTAKRGDSIYVTLKYTAIEFLDEEEKQVNEATKQLIDSLTKTDLYISNLGAGTSYNKAIEDIIVDLGVKITKTTEKIITLPNDAIFGEHAGKKVRFSCEFKDMVCREGDVVKVNYVGYYTDNAGNIKLNDKGEKESFDSGNGVRFFLGSGLAIEDFENGIIGMRVGETNKKEITATFPDDYSTESFQGKKVIFEVTVLEIDEVETYSDKFVKDHLGFDTMAEFEDNLKKSYADDVMQNILISESKFIDYPRREYKEMKDQFEAYDAEFMNYYGFSFEDYISSTGMTKREYIEASMQLEMIYYAIANAQGFAPVKGDAYLTQARKDLIEENKKAYLSTYPSTPEDKAYEIAEEYVDKELGTAAIYEKAIYTFVEAHLKENITIKMVDKKTEDK